MLHVIRHVTSKNKKYALEALCIDGECYRCSVGSFDPQEKTLHVTWLDHLEGERTQHVKTELITETGHDEELALRLTPPPTLSGNARARAQETLIRMLDGREFRRKRSLETALAEKLPEFAAVNLSHRNDLRLGFPELANLVKELRIEGKVPFGIYHGHHVFGSGRVAEEGPEHSRELAHQRLRDHRVRPGPIRVRFVYYIPVDSEREIGHFFQAVFPRAEIRTPFHRVTLQCWYRDRKDSTATFRIDRTNLTLTAYPNRMEIRGSLQEKDLALSLVKIVVMGNVLAREVTSSARPDAPLLHLRGRTEFPSTVLIHNQLPRSEVLWRTEYTNIHRTLYGFPSLDDSRRVSVSQRMILSHSHVPQQFAPELVDEHLRKFQLLFLRDYVGSLAKEDEYVPPSILRAYAPKGEEIDSLVAGLTNLYEERLKKSALERERADRQVSNFLNRSNFWLSLIVMLFSIAAATEEKWLNWIVAVVALVFVGYTFGKTFHWREPRTDRS